jgi:hypothetical protein
LAHLALANEWALDGEGHGALIDLDCATYDADHVLSSPLTAPVEDVGAWFSGSRGAVLRKLGRWAGGRPRPPSNSHGPAGSSATCTARWSVRACGWPRVTRTRQRPTSPRTLDTCHAPRAGQPRPFIAAAARELPDAVSARRLAGLLRG